jgi:Kef-type K+ transport system membrane component KefB
LSISEILSNTEFQMSLLMFVALAGYLISYRINQSAVVGIILVGIAVGPSLLNWISYTEFVATLAELGAVVLLFTIGLEFEIKEIWKAKYFLIALFGVLVPAVGGYFVAEWFGFDFKASIIIGTALTATSIAITANILREMGKLQTAAASAIIGAAVIDDVLSLMALSISQGIVSNNFSTVSILIVAAKAIGFIVVGTVIGQLLLRKLLILLDKTKIAHAYPESLFIFAMMVAFLYALAAHLVGLSAIVGAFLAGAAFAKVELKSGKIFREGAHHLQIIFAAIFFISLGVIMDLHAISLELLVFILVLTVVAMITKLIGCGTTAKLTGYGWRDTFIIGVGMAPRGEVAMIIGLIGLNKNIISQSAYSAVILMSLLTTIVLPFIFKGFFYKSKEKYLPVHES